jgi:hypothetical protein
MGLKDGFVLGDWVVHPMQGTFAAFLGRLDEAIAAFETALTLESVSCEHRHVAGHIESNCFRCRVARRLSATF